MEQMRYRWYVVGVESAHRGAGSKEHHDTYIYARNPIEVLNKLRVVRGRKKAGTFPTITPLSEREGGWLEDIISEREDFSVYQARKFHFTPRNLDYIATHPQSKISKPKRNKR